MEKRLWLVVGIFALAVGLAILLPWIFSHITMTVGPLSFDTKTISYAHAGKDNRDTYSINAKYPFFTEGLSDDIAGKINDTLTASVRTTALAVKKEFEAQFSGENGEQSIYIPAEPMTYGAESKVSADLNKLPFVNVKMTGYQYAGGAHGITVLTTYVFDSKTGSEITLPVLFTGDYLNTLSRLSLAELKRQDPEFTTYTFANDGTLPDKNNFSAFTLEPDGMHVFFQDYQVGPYVIGEPEIVIPYSDLRTVIASKYRDILK